MLKKKIKRLYNIYIVIVFFIKYLLLSVVSDLINVL